MKTNNKKRQPRSVGIDPADYAILARMRAETGMTLKAIIHRAVAAYVSQTKSRA